MLEGRAVSKREKFLSLWSLYSICGDLKFNIIVSFSFLFLFKITLVDLSTSLYFVMQSTTHFTNKYLNFKIESHEIFKFVNDPGGILICQN